MNLRTFLPCLAAAVLAASAMVAEMPPIENFDGWGSLPEVKGGFEHAVKRETAENPLRGVPDGSSAGRIADDAHVWSWRPVWHRDGAGGIRVPWLAVSPDRSVLVVAESIGAQPGPNATLLVLFNQYTGKIGRAIPLENRKITAAAWLPDGVSLLLAEAAQPLRKTSARLAVLDLRTGKILRELDLPGWEAAALAVDELGSGWLAGNGRLYEVDTETFGLKEIAATAGPAALAAAPDGIYLADTDGLRRFDFDGVEAKRWPWKSPWEVASLVPGPAGSVLAIGRDEQAKLLAGGVVSDWDTPVLTAVWLPGENAFAVAWRQRQGIGLVAADGAPTEVKSRPRTGVARALIALPEGDFAVFNVTGELQRLSATRRSLRALDFY